MSPSSHGPGGLLRSTTNGLLAHPKQQTHASIWTYGVNDHLEELPTEMVRAFRPSGSFRTDFVVLCERCGVVPCTALAPPLSSAGAAEGSTLAVQSALLDRASMQVVKCIIPSSLHLEILRFSGCYLDVEMLGMLRAGLTDMCTVRAVQLDWNPLEIPLDLKAVAIELADNSVDNINELESTRAREQGKRALRAFGETLAVYGDWSEVLQSVAAVACADKRWETLAKLEPLDVESWSRAFIEKINMPTAEVEIIFDILDGPGFGCGERQVPMSRLEEALAALPELSAEDEVADPVAGAVAAFIDGSSILELLSLRHCNIGRIEARAIGRNLRSSPHLRALNLWSNRVNDRGAMALAEAFEANFSLQHLGLGRNQITHVGLECLCRPLGATRVDSKEQADPIIKDIKDKTKERDKRRQPPPPKRDARGRERHTPEVFLGTCEERSDLGTGQTYWLWTRNLALKKLSLEHNPIGDAASVLRLQPYGLGGDLVLRGVPCAQELIDVVKTARDEKAADESVGDVKAWPDPKSMAGGWNLILQ